MAETLNRYHYRALTRDGEEVSGLLEAANEQSLTRRLHAEGKLPIKISAANAQNRVWALLMTDISRGPSLSGRERTTFIQGLATLVEAGLPLDRALEIAGNLSETRRMRAVAGRLLERMKAGRSLADAIADEKSAFPPVTIGIIRAAEASARLGPVLARLAETEGSAGRRRAALRSAMIYPVFLIVTAIICVSVLMIFVVPTFAPMLEESGRELPRVTALVISLADGIRSAGPVLMLMLLALGALFQVLLRRSGFRILWHRCLLQLPIIGPIRCKLASSDFARVLGELLTGGVDLSRALKLTQPGIADAAIHADLARAVPAVEDGAGLASAFRGRHLAPLTINFMEIGERSGKLGQMLIKSADILEGEAKTALDRAVGLVTPAVTLVMGGVIAVIVSSILFALFSINELAIQ